MKSEHAHLVEAASAAATNPSDTAFDALGMTIIQRLDPWSGGRVLLVSSARPGEGKSFVAAQLARRAAALLDAPVALVDANAAHPSVEPKQAGEDSTGGLFDCLAARELLADRLHETTTPGLWAMPSARRSSQQALLFRLGATKAVLDAMRARFALTVIDGASLPQAGCLALQADGTLVVVDASRTRRDIVSGALDTPYVKRESVLGVVLNRRPEYVPRWLYRSLL